MESDATQPAIFDKLWVWAETHTKQLLVGLAAVLVVGLVIAFWFVHQGQQQTDANDALSKLAARSILPNAPAPNADALLTVASDFSGTDAGQRAILLAASDLFAQGKYDQALGQFQRILQQQGDSPFTGQAALGVAATMEAQGRTQDAINAYRNVTEHYQQNWNVGPQAKLALARLLEAQGKLTEARDELMESVRTYPAEGGAEANMRLRELLTAHPELIPASPAPANSPILGNNTRPIAPAPAVVSTNRPAGSPPALNIKPATNQP